MLEEWQEQEVREVRLDRTELRIATSVSQSPWQTSIQWGHSKGVEGQVVHLYTAAHQAK